MNEVKNPPPLYSTSILCISVYTAYMLPRVLNPSPLYTLDTTSYI